MSTANPSPEDRPVHPESRNLRSLQDRIRNHAKKEGVLQARVERRLAAVIIAEMLSRVDLGIDGPPLLVKGGSALELRLGLAASRSSADLDTVIRGTMAEFIKKAKEALAAPLRGFTGKMIDEREIPVGKLAVKPRQFKVKLSYRGRPFKTVTVEASAAEGGVADVFDPVTAPCLPIHGMDELPDIPCMTVAYQVAQKIHACTEPNPGGKPNPRARDLVDLLLLRELVTDHRQAREACLEVFTVRGVHGWPPALTVQPAWDAIYRQAAEGLDQYVPRDVADAADQVRDFIASIDAATS